MQCLYWALIFFDVSTFPFLSVHGSIGIDVIIVKIKIKEMYTGPQSASSHYVLAHCGAARIGPVKKCKRYPRRPNMMGFCGPSGERRRGPPAVACIGPSFCRRADIPFRYLWFRWRLQDFFSAPYNKILLVSK